MCNAFLFPGQGSQEVGMGRELYNSLSAVRDILQRANEVLGYDLMNLMFQGPMEKLTDTRYAQPAVYTCSAMYLEKARAEGLACDYAAGHSLGEYTALYAAGVLSFEDGLRLVDRRGQAMAAQNGKGTMAAVLGLTEEELEPHMVPGVVMANLNAKTQIVISGSESAVKEMRGALESDDVKVKMLKVSAAFHSPQMAEAAEIMKPLIDETEFHAPKCAVMSNVTGRPAADVGEIKENLICQITGQVRWYDTILFLKKAGVERLYEVGNGDILKKLNKGITLRPKCLPV